MDRDGLKQVRNRRYDALARVRWDHLETLLAEHYAAHGYRVEHVGTGGIRQRFDGGIDLKLRKDDEYILVQCKGWNAYQVPHNEVHQLIGLMVNEGATGAVLVTTGEFTRAAIEAATRGGHVQLVDGDDLRQMLGPLPSGDSGMSPSYERGGDRPEAGRARRVATTAADRLLSAAEDRIRYGSRGPRRVGRTLALGLGAKIAVQLLAFLLFALVLYFTGRAFIGAVESLSPTTTRVPVPVQQPRPQPIPPPGSPAPVDSASPPAMPSPVPYEPTPEDIRRSRRDADEAMKVIQDTTPEI